MAKAQITTGTVNIPIISVGTILKIGILGNQVGLIEV